ncbi:MFS transporter [Dehalobacterium formicoaceticum]|uniref:MFS transporter n=1 Tax=Dehalobacterium formicoaceticum TaxID=51515 RepID=A0ABT1Y515_9FIRM|nr:MFS transporter [Dehalobacterium formicoaceticum]MCR6544781.1 MFS transporter [Dehalobacterium formicoaceticum]
MKPTKGKLKLWNKYYVIVLFVSLFCYFAEYINTTAIPLFTVSIGGDESTAGIFMTVVSITALFFRPYLGYVMDKKSRKRILVLGTVCMSIAALSFSFVNLIPLIMTLAIFQGIAVSSITTAGPTVVTDVTVRSKLAEGISLYSNALNLSIALGPMVALGVINRFGYVITFRTSFAISLLAIILVIMLNYEHKQTFSLGSSAPRSEGFNIKIIFEKTAIKPALYQFFMAFCAALIWSFIPLYGLSRGIENIGMFFPVYAGATIIVSLFTGKLVQRFGVKKVFVPGLIMQLFAFISLAYAQSLPLIMLGGFLYGMGSASGFAIISFIVMDLAPSHRRGAANATLFAAMDVGVALGSALMGIITAQFGFTVTFSVAAAMIGLNIIIFLLTQSSQPAKQG